MERPIGYYYYRSELVKEMKNKLEEKSRPFVPVLMELKQYWKNIPKYTRGYKYGYEYGYALPIHPNVYKYQNPSTTSKTSSWYYYKERHNPDFIPIITKALKQTCVMEKVGDKWVHGNQKDDWQTWDDERLKNELRHSSVYRYIEHEISSLKKKKADGLVHIKLQTKIETKVSYPIVLRLKRWDKVTKETSNKGLQANTHNYLNWCFDSYASCDDLKVYCKQNGFKPEKKKKYKYGDYAEWILHTLE